MATNFQTAQEVHELFYYCQNEGGHKDFLRQSETAQRYYASQQWSQADLAKRNAEGRMSFTVNEVFRTINALRGEMQNLSTDMRFDPGAGGDPRVATALNKLSEHIDRQNKSYMQDDLVRFNGLLLGRGFYEMRVEFDKNMQGNITYRSKRPQNVVLDADMDSPDPKDWGRVFTTEIVSLDDIEALYGRGKVEAVKGWPLADFVDLDDRNLAASIGRTSPMRDGSFDPNNRTIKQYRLISEQYRDFKMKEFFVDLRTGDQSEIPETWSREKIRYALDTYGLGTTRRKAKTVRWRVVCNDEVLHDEDSPYEHFTIVPYFPYFVDGHPISLFDILRSPQDMVNYTVSEEMKILGTTSHSGWKVRQGSLKNMTPRDLEQKGSKNGLVMELENIDDAERITPGQPATGFERLGDRSRSWIADLANVTPTMLGQQGQYAAGKGMDTQLSRAPVNLSAALTAFQFTKHLCAEIKLNLIQTFYTETRSFNIARGNYGDVEEVTVNEPVDEYGAIANNLTVGSYSIRMLPVTSRTAADEFAFDELIQMKDLGITVPNSLFITASSLQAKADMIEILLEANNGEVSPEEQRANELQLAQLEADVAKTQAAAQQSASAAELNQARARKNDADASFNPHAARIELDRERLGLERDRDTRRMASDERKRDSDAALKLTEIAQKGIQDENKAAMQAEQHQQKLRQNEETHRQRLAQQKQARQTNRSNRNPKQPR